jgi:hypothetical protein
MTILKDDITIPDWVRVHPLYREWYDIRRRCYDPLHPRYPQEGAKGIKMHEPWINDPGQFIKDVVGGIGTSGG